jgi:hypothetical protein
LSREHRVPIDFPSLAEAGFIVAGEDLLDAQLLTLAATGALRNERVLTPGTGLDLNDGGAGGAATLDIDISEFAAEQQVAVIADSLLGYDASLAGEVRFPLWALRVGRKGAVIGDECFFGSTAQAFEGSVVPVVSGTGAAIASQTGEQNHPGVIRLATGTTLSGHCALAAGNAPDSVRLGGGAVRFGAITKIANLSDTLQDFVTFMGLRDGPYSGEPVDGVYFRYNDGVNSGRWQGIARSNSVETVLNGAVAFAADTAWHAFEIEINAGGTSAEFFVDGASMGTVGSNIPTAAGRETSLCPAHILKTLGTTSRAFDIDAYYYAFEFTTAR